MNISRPLLLACLAATLSLPAWSAEDKKDKNSKAAEALEDLADDGDKKAQLQLGIAYLTGKYAVDVDAKIALKWLTKAATGNKKKNIPHHPRALLYLGFCWQNVTYTKLLEREVDHEKALKYYIEAEKSMLPEAAQYAGLTLKTLGRHKEAAVYFKRAADRKLQRCEVEYAKVLLEGRGLAADPPSAIPYLEHAAQGGNAEAIFLLADIHAGKYEGVPLNHDQMIEYLWQAATEHPAAMARIGNCYQYGVGLQQDIHLAVKWYERAAMSSPPDTTGLLALGRCYSTGAGVEKNDRAAFELYLRAAVSPDSPAIADYNTALCYHKGKGAGKNLAFASRYFLRAAEKGLPQAMNLVGEMSEHGELYAEEGDTPLPADTSTAMEWYKKAADKQDPHALYNLARCHRDGIGTEPNAKLAELLFRKAAELGVTGTQPPESEKVKTQTKTTPKGF